jgi:hypothetical protein
VIGKIAPVARAVYPVKIFGNGAGGNKQASKYKNLFQAAGFSGGFNSIGQTVIRISKIDKANENERNK